MPISDSKLLIRDYADIRDILRDIYIFGCFSRDDYISKGISGRKYDNEQRRIASYLPSKFIKKKRDGKRVLPYCSYDMTETSENFIAETYRNKSFTILDVMSYFFILSVLENKQDITLSEILKIIPEDRDVETYWASSIRKGDRPGFYTYSGRVYFLMHTIFTGTKSFYDDECPKDLQETFENTLVSWNDAYYRCDDEYIKSRIFGLMSIVGHDMGTAYYAIAKENVDRYLSDEWHFKLNDYIGYGLGDFTLPEEKDLFKEILKLPDEKIICILSKAVWGNPEFIWNFPIHITMKYFDLAIARLGELAGKSANRKASKDITMCIEYILAVYRLREKYSTSETVMKALSQNNRNVQRLYEYLEKIIDMARDHIIEIKCLLNLEIADKGIYESIPNLLYALLVYITGDTEAGDIRIKGLSMEDLEV